MFGFLKNWLFDDDTTGSSTTMNDSINSKAGSFLDNGPSVNIDGSPMSGGIDIQGNPYGVTDSFSCGSGLFDDSGIHSNIGCGTDDMFGSSTSSSLDDPFNSGIGCSGNLFDD